MAGSGKMTSAKAKEVAEDYLSTLSDLTSNSKPMINALTIVAGDNIEHAAVIAQVVESHLQKVRSDIKLPVLYLIDSIVKNVNGPYLNLFTQNIVNLFCNVFEKVDEGTRASMYKLRQTWNDVFPTNKLFSLDVKVHAIDPAWPITASVPPPSGSIHVNPRFLSMTQQQTTSPKPVTSTSTEAVTTNEEAAMREQLLKKQRELLELQKQKLELELLQTQASIEQQQRQLNKQAVLLKTTETIPSAEQMRALEDSIIQDKQVVTVAPSVSPNLTIKKFPAASAALLKNLGSGNGPRIAPANSVAVMNAKMMSRDPRLKPTSPVAKESTTTPVDPRIRPSEPNSIEDKPHQQQSGIAVVPAALSEQLKQQMNPKKVATNKSEPSDIASSNDNANTNVNNKSISGNENKDASLHRTSRKKDPRLSLNNSGDVSNNNSKAIHNQSVGSCSTSASPNKSSNKKSSAGEKRRSKQRPSRSSKVAKIEQDNDEGAEVAEHSSSSSQSSPTILVTSSVTLSANTATVIASSSSSSSSSSPSCSSTKNRKKNASSKSRKRSPSPRPFPTTAYRIPRRSEAKANAILASPGGVTEEEQSGSLIVSPPHPPAFKDIKSNAKQRNYIRRNKDGSGSPESTVVAKIAKISGQAQSESLLQSSNKDEDLRATLPIPTAADATGVNAKKEDLDLRVIQPVIPLKRRSTEHLDSALAKKSKAEKFDALFGNEDVDLRTLTHPHAGRPPTPPPPVISGDDGKDGWAKLKSPTKAERDKQVANAEEKRERDRTRDRLGRPRLYNKLPDDPKERRRTLSSDDVDTRTGRRGREIEKHERNTEKSIEIIMKQAAEELENGLISKSQYNNLIQEVLQVSEDQKLRAAQRKEKEMSSMIWEKGYEKGITDRQQGYGTGDSEKFRPRNPNGPRWQGQPWAQGPWAHPPFGPQGHYNSDFRHIGPWQNPRYFGPMRPDFSSFHGFNQNLGHSPRMGMMGPMGPNGPLMPNHMIGNGPMGTMSGMANGPMGHLGKFSPGSRNATPKSYDVEDDDSKLMGTSSDLQSRELPLPDQKLMDQIRKDTMKSIHIDSVPREIRYYGQTGVVFLNWDEPREIGFQNGIRRILVDDMDMHLAFNEPYKDFVYNGEVHRIRLGAPTRELYIDDKWYEGYFGGPPITVELSGKQVKIKLEGPPPQVKIGNVKRTDLVIAKINLIINARNMVPVFLDSKPQIFEFERHGESNTLEFIDSLRTVLLNGRPFKVEFGGLPKPVYIRNKQHFIRFSVLPRGVRAGRLRISGMRGEGPIESPPLSPLSAQKSSMEAATSLQIYASSMEPDSTSQDASDVASANKSDLQLDVLSSALPSAMAPASGLSYQAEPIENSPAPMPCISLPDMSKLFQRLVETGIVPAQNSEPKKHEEEEKRKKKKESEVLITFDKPETLKIKQTGMSTQLYSGMQCSSCGARFAPELATRYSHHLDWHFRQNRRERDSARKAHSRSWYYDVSDWIQFEEIEDLEDRAQSWFETEKQSAEMESASADEVPPEAMQSSVSTGTDEDSRCQVCHDTFEQFYNEEKEEWHLRPTLKYEDKNYHPLCLEDHKRIMENAALALEESLEDMEEDKSKSEEIEETSDEPAKDDLDKEESKIEIQENPVSSMDDDEGIEIIENSIEKKDTVEIIITDDIEDEDAAVSQNGSGDGIEVLESRDVMIELSTMPELGNNAFQTVKIKQEPLDVDETADENFDFSKTDVKTESNDEADLDERLLPERTAADTTHVAMKSSMDGNVELDSAPSAIPSAPSRIKINITKPLVASKEPEEPKEKAPENPSDESSEPLVPASIKPALQGRKLSVLPPVEKGQELSGLCTIM